MYNYIYFNVYIISNYIYIDCIRDMMIYDDYKTSGMPGIAWMFYVCEMKTTELHRMCSTNMSKLISVYILAWASTFISCIYKCT